MARNRNWNAETYDGLLSTTDRAFPEPLTTSDTLLTPALCLAIGSVRSRDMRHRCREHGSVVEWCVLAQWGG